MKRTIHFDRFFAFSESNNKYFNTTFGDRLNIIYGKNTSGKSTLIQSILYTFGINSENLKLKEILDSDVIFRLDFTLKSDHEELISIIRDNNELIIKREKGPAKRFIGISGDSSQEHIKLKSYLGDLFNFHLNLNSSGTYKQAALEAFFLPYYVAQDIGWVYPFKSFKGLDYIKGFKTDFFDYYLGITTGADVEKKLKLEAKKKEHDTKKDFLVKSIQKDILFEVARAKDENYIEKANTFINAHKGLKQELIKCEEISLTLANKISLLQRQKKLLTTIKRELLQQKPANGRCPTCKQYLSNSLDNHYKHYQDTNNTNEELILCKNKIKELQGKNNSNDKRIVNLKKEIKKGHEALKAYSVDEVSFAEWLDRKTKVKLLEKTERKIGKLEILSNKIGNKLKYYTDIELNKTRKNYSNQFKNIFQEYLLELGIKHFDDTRYLLLYQIPGFPKQGVELLKTLLAFYFAFNKIIYSTSNIHRCPFLLDSVFEGDVEDDNKNRVLRFINHHFPEDTQTLITIADDVDSKTPVKEYNKKIFNNTAKLICIGNNREERSFLVDYNGLYTDYLDETRKLLEDT